MVDFVYLHVVEAAEVSRFLLRERHCDVTDASAAHVRRAVGGATTIVRRLEFVAARSPENTQRACVNTGNIDSQTTNVLTAKGLGDSCAHVNGRPVGSTHMLFITCALDC